MELKIINTCDDIDRSLKELNGDIISLSKHIFKKKLIILSLVLSAMLVVSYFIATQTNTLDTFIWWVLLSGVICIYFNISIPTKRGCSSLAEGYCGIDDYNKAKRLLNDGDILKVTLAIDLSKIIITQAQDRVVRFIELDDFYVTHSLDCVEPTLDLITGEVVIPYNE